MAFWLAYKGSVASLYEGKLLMTRSNNVDSFWERPKKNLGWAKAPLKPNHTV